MLDLAQITLVILHVFLWIKMLVRSLEREKCLGEQTQIQALTSSVPFWRLAVSS